MLLSLFQTLYGFFGSYWVGRLCVFRCLFHWTILLAPWCILTKSLYLCFLTFLQNQFLLSPLSSPAVAVPLKNCIILACFRTVCKHNCAVWIVYIRELSFSLHNVLSSIHNVGSIFPALKTADRILLLNIPPINGCVVCKLLCHE